MKLILIIIFVFILPLYSQTDLDSDTEYLAKYIGYWPPPILGSEDSLEMFKGELQKYIQKLKDNVYNIKDSSFYYFKLGQAYHFGHNIDMSNSYDLAEKYLKKSILIDVYNLASRIELGTLFVSSDLKNYERGYKLLYNAVKKDTANKFIGARYTLAMCATAMGEDYVARQAALEYKNLSKEQGYTNLNDWVKFIHHNYLEYIESDTADNRIEYKNHYSGFYAKFPKNFTLYRDEVFNQRLASSELSLKTPKAYSIITDSITNAISVSAKNTKYYTYNKVIDDFLENMTSKNNINRKSNVIYPIYQSYYFQSTFKPYENYKGVITVIKSADFYYSLIYNATESTFDQNYHYFKEFEKNFRIIERKKKDKL